MATSLFFMPTDQNSGRNQNEVVRNTQLVNNFSEIPTEPPRKSRRGRKPGSKTNPKTQKKPILRGMGIAKLERVIEEDEKKTLGVATSAPNPNNPTRRLSVVPDPVVVLQGFPSYGGGPTTNTTSSCAQRSRRLYSGGIGSGHQIMFDPVCSPWGFVETYAHHDLSSISNPQVYDTSCFKKKRLDENDHYLLQPDQRSQCFFYDHGITNHTVSMEEFESISPINGTGNVKEYEFFPGKYEGFSGKYGKMVSGDTSVSDCSSTTSTIDLSLKL